MDRSSFFFIVGVVALMEGGKTCFGVVVGIRCDLMLKTA